MNPEVDVYLSEGCGRCEYFSTPRCKVNTWRSELIELRRIILESGLDEEIKWGQPCYTYKGKNILIMGALRDYASISFFKGSLLTDPENLLFAPGKNSQAARLFKFTSLEQLLDLEPLIKSYIAEAVEIEKQGLKVAFKKEPEPMPQELLEIFDENPLFKSAFEALTPGRQRGYILYFSGAKQSATRCSRIRKYIPKIFEGKGMQDR